jgi:hypothetical protein
MVETKVTLGLATILATDRLGCDPVIEADMPETPAPLGLLRHELIKSEIAEFRGDTFTTMGDRVLIKFSYAAITRARI